MSPEKYKENAIFTALRNASCSKGWLRWLVQLFFGIIIVSSFTLILLMSLKTSQGRNELDGRCRVMNCRVICYQTPYFEKYENDIIEAVWKNNAICPNIILTLSRPYFFNSTLPQNWLSVIRSNVNELAIIGGNLNHIPPGAFNTQFSSKLQTLILEKVKLWSWEPETFVGLTSLERLYIKDCTFANVKRHALKAVDDTLVMLDIQSRFEWNPVNITGSANPAALRIVDFSLNPFYSILNKFSFSQLRKCRILYLNSCRISYLGAGTFDPLISIQELYLNDNYLDVITDGLFTKIIPRKPRIAMHNNLWNCNCSFTELRELFSKDLIIVDPICHLPEKLNGNTFAEFEEYCGALGDHDHKLVKKDEVEVNECNKNNNIQSFHINGVCYNSTCKVYRVFSNAYKDNCLLNKAEVRTMTKTIILQKRYMVQDSDWLSLTLSLRSNHLAMAELSPKNHTPDQGLLWFQSSCPRDIYCINVIPDVLRIFDENYSIEYTFCPFNLRSSGINTKKCTSFSLADVEVDIIDEENTFMIAGFTVLSIICLICGALCVYALIHRNPNLLKGNKRILFVKHKEINALILPPKIPLRKSFDAATNENLEKKIFFIATCEQNVTSVEPSESFTYPNSNEVSYISALQPTDEQLAEWRKKQTDTKSQYKPLTSDLYNYSKILNNDSLPYYSLNEKVSDTPLSVGKK